MDINILAITIFALFFGYKAYKQFSPQKAEMVTSAGLPVPISSGKERSFVNKTSDAGLYTYNLKRQKSISV